MWVHSMNMEDHSGSTLFLCTCFKNMWMSLKSFCSTVESVNRGSEGGRDTGKLQERKQDSREEKRSDKRTSSGGLSNFIPSDSRLPMNQNSPIKMILTP